jgi:UDP:flavonoid glycosyltransferase YjiC (YdhE family)
LAGAPVRVLASTNGQDPAAFPAPANAVVVPWMSYARTMPACDLVVCHGGHGTLARALCSGCAVVVCPAAGDMAESAARVDWAGLGVRLPRRLLGPRALRLAVERTLADARLHARARAVAAWAAGHDGAGLAAREIEAWAARRGITVGSR